MRRTGVAEGNQLEIIDPALYAKLHYSRASRAVGADSYDCEERLLVLRGGEHPVERAHSRVAAIGILRVDHAANVEGAFSPLSI